MEASEEIMTTIRDLKKKSSKKIHHNFSLTTFVSLKYIKIVKTKYHPKIVYSRYIADISPSKLYIYVEPADIFN